MSTLVIPQEATELTLDELKLICGGHDHGEEKKRKCKLVAKIVTVKKIFRCNEHNEHKDFCNDNNNDCDN